MATEKFEEGTTPAIREAPDEYPCPFCGKNSLIRSFGDLSDDNFRIELYCKNPLCDTRVMTIIGLRMNGEVSNHRADAAAIQAVDRGTEAEQEAEGVELIRDERGEVIGSMISAGDVKPDFVLGSAKRRMERRERPTKVILRPK
jgi:hypothetical protein